MKKAVVLLFVVIGTLLGLVTCEAENEHKKCSVPVESSIAINAQPGANLPFIVFDTKVGKTSERDTLRSANGQFRKTWQLTRPAVVRLYIPGRYVRLWVAPGYHSEIKLPVNPDEPYAFSGDGQLEKSYADKIQAINMSDFPKAAKGGAIMKPETFFDKANRISQRRDSVHRAYLKTCDKAISKNSYIAQFFKMEEDTAFSCLEC